ncbi:hypothetical protein [Pseudonocardia broussonetiae]|uniref:DUF5666 domain-containing protein n=1 Tax=Pseudonocardia broussonetiae TaxID=2736640 RepID=A0A6M6JD99_9PSEU|nr:hypothetical protein [Pseudonocardia broussonetiae]QJY44887.1 hypothetical protein HOP40_02730 [Pseudonocardia broussonetiae]
MTGPTTTTRRWRRPRGRVLVIGAVVLAALVVAGVVAALLVPGGGPGRGDDRRGVPGIGLTGEYDELDGGPGLGGPVDGPGRGDRGPRGEGLGDDAVLVGTVVSTSEGTLVVTPDGAAQRSLRTTDDTRVRGSGNAALGDLAPGERVVVRVDGTGDAATAVSVTAPQARVTGTVTALTGTSATVVAVDGRTVTVDVGGLGQQPAVGDVVVLTGTITDGATLTADGVRILPRAS